MLTFTAGSPEDVLNAGSLSEEGIDHWSIIRDHWSLQEIAEQRQNWVEVLKLPTL